MSSSLTQPMPFEYNGDLIQYNNHGKNLVVAGRHKDGYPNYLVGPEFIDMAHSQGVDISRTGIVKASSDRTSYEKTIPLRTQKAKLSSYPWVTTEGTKNGWWEYTFTDTNRPTPVLVGLFLNGVHDNQPTFSFKKWQLLGYNETTSSWDVIYKEDNDPQFRGWANPDKDYGRMYWFTDNVVPYKKIRININENHGGTYTGVYTIRFYEQVVPLQHKYDTALYASDKEPFIASVSCGLNEDGTQVVDKLLRIINPVNYPGNMLAECTRNYMYIVPQNSDGVFPTNLDSDRAVEIPQANMKGQRFYLYSDHRKIHYGTLRDIEIQCAGLLQSNTDETGEYPINVDKRISHDQSLYNFPLRFYRVGISAQNSYRGSSGSYDLSSTSTKIIIVEDPSPVAYFPNRSARLNNNCCTLEIDVKWSGSSSTVDSGYSVIFDAGWYNNLGWALRYNNFERALTFQTGTALTNGTLYLAPCNLDDNQWHTISVSINYDKLYIHVDGKCVGAFDNRIQHRFDYNYWFIGRWIHSDGCSFFGYINNFRYTLGSCLYGGRDYAVSPKFNTSLIPDKTLWFDEESQIVKEYNAATNTWINTPMLPIGCIETGRREHLLTDNPRGTHHLNQMKYVDNGEWAQSASYDGNHIGKCIFNYGHNSHSYGYHTPNNNNVTEHWIQFGLYEPMAFDRFYITQSSSSRLQCVHKFKLLGSNDKVTWDTLIDNSPNYSYTGLFSTEIATIEPVTAINTYKSYSYDNETKYKYYKIVLPPKSDIPAIYRNNYTCLKTLFFFKDSKPEVLKRTSVMCGHKWTYGPICMLNNEFKRLDIPTDNIQFEASGMCSHWGDSHNAMRPMNSMSGWYSGGHSVQGESIYVKDDELWIHTGNAQAHIYNGANYGPPIDQFNVDDTRRMYYITIKRL